MNIIFLGTPKVASQVASGLLGSKHKIVAVVSQVDKPVGRKQILEPTATKVFAAENNIPCYQFKSIKRDGVDVLKELNADIMITCAYGQILNQSVLDITPKGVINVHASLLPKYRGSSPIQWSLMNGEKKIGITYMKTGLGLDDGAMICKYEIDIADEDNAETLFEKIGELGKNTISEVLDKIEEGLFSEIVQNEKEMTYYPMLKKIDGEISFSDSAEKINNLIRGLYLWPNAYAYLHKNNEHKLIKFFKAEVSDEEIDGKLGEVVKVSKDRFFVKCKKGLLVVLECQISGQKRLSAREIINGKKIELGDKILDGDAD